MTWRRLALAAAALFAVWMLLAPRLATFLIVEDRPQRVDAIVVLSGSAAYRERTAHAARLYHAGLAPDVLLTNDGQRSSWSQPDGRNPFFYERAFDELLRLGVPRARIHVLPDLVTSTFEETALLRRHVCAARLHALMVVTSGYHTRRARWTFRALMPASLTLVVSPAPVGVGGHSPGSTFWWIYVRGWRQVALEYVKATVYWLRYPVMRGDGAGAEC